nr:hypothetical protein CFP56_54514 [Quercus suber]
MEQYGKEVKWPGRSQRQRVMRKTDDPDEYEGKRFTERHFVQEINTVVWQASFCSEIASLSWSYMIGLSLGTPKFVNEQVNTPFFPVETSTSCKGPSAFASNLRIVLIACVLVAVTSVGAHGAKRFTLQIGTHHTASASSNNNQVTSVYLHGMLAPQTLHSPGLIHDSYSTLNCKLYSNHLFLHDPISAVATNLSRPCRAAGEIVVQRFQDPRTLSFQSRARPGFGSRFIAQCLKLLQVAVLPDRGSIVTCRSEAAVKP